MTAPKTYPTRNPLLRLMAINCLTGLFIALMMVGGLLWTDTAHLWTLISTSDEPLIPMVLLSLGLMLTLSSLAISTAIMALPYNDPQDPPNQGTHAPETLVYAYAKSRSSRRR